MNIELEEVEEFVGDGGDGAIGVCNGYQSIGKGRGRSGEMLTFLNAKKEFKRPIGFVTGRERNVLELAGRIGDLIESACGVRKKKKGYVHVLRYHFVPGFLESVTCL